MISKVEQSILMAGADDWVSLGEIAAIVRRESKSDESEDVRVLVAIRHLATEKLVDLGDLAVGGFFAWDAPVEVSMARVERLLRDSQDSRRYGAWIANTAQGDRLAAGFKKGG